jgi:hypothetical protein
MTLFTKDPGSLSEPDPTTPALMHSPQTSLAHVIARFGTLENRHRCMTRPSHVGIRPVAVGLRRSQKAPAFSARRSAVECKSVFIYSQQEENDVTYLFLCRVSCIVIRVRELCSFSVLQLYVFRRSSTFV